MKIKPSKKFIIYAAIWLVLFAMFASITFIIPDFFRKTETVIEYKEVTEIITETVDKVDENGVVIGQEEINKTVVKQVPTEVEKVVVSRYRSPLFWVAFVLTLFSFVAQLACAFLALARERSFVGIPLFYTSLGTLVATVVICEICMILYKWLSWFGIIVCILTVGFSLIAVLKSNAAATAIEAVDKKVKTKTMYIKMLTADAQTTVTKTENEEIKAIAKKVYENVRFSDPMSDSALSMVEEKITEKFAEYDKAVQDGNLDAVKETSAALNTLIAERNAKCKMLK